MAQESQVGTLKNLLSNYQTFITYRPLRTEAAAFECLPSPARTYEIPPRASLDPVAEAEKARTFAGSDAVAILLPGRRFDAAGTRLGQGGGWYDRFLAEVPRGWLRIGFCYTDQFSEALLPRQSWDQPVDYVAVVHRGTGALALYSSEGDLS